MEMGLHRQTLGQDRTDRTEKMAPEQIPGANKGAAIHGPDTSRTRGLRGWNRLKDTGQEQ